jgi:hypothetical protein
MTRRRARGIVRHEVGNAHNALLEIAGLQHHGNGVGASFSVEPMVLAVNCAPGRTQRFLPLAVVT